MNDEFFIKKTFDLAQKALGKTWPNPLVGSVIVKDGRIIGEGFHKGPGLPHAEIEALNNCGESPEGSILYVNLEPCCHTNKRTPPCAQRLIKEKIKRVVVANMDPNPEVNGKGLELLKSQGIDILHGVLKGEGEKLNEVFFHAQRTRSPFIHLKLATTLDGKIALPNGESQWITGKKARDYVHVLRSYSQGIIIGAETLRVDNPKLNVRLPEFQGVQPYRIVFSQSGDLPTNSTLFRDALREKTLVYTNKKTSLPLPPENIRIIANLREAMHDLFERKLFALFLEGGGSLASSFMKENLVNRVSLFLNPSFLGSGKNGLSDFGLNSLQDRPMLKNLSSSWIGDDLYLTGIF